MPAAQGKAASNKNVVTLFKTTKLENPPKKGKAASAAGDKSTNIQEQPIGVAIKDSIV